MVLRRGVSWFVVAGILVVYVASVLHLHPENLFGRAHDDTIYFSSAKALAEGRGYILPSVPGTPPATEYPILYPWVLSWVWRWNPSFPANVVDAVRVTIAFGVVFILLAFQFFRSFKGLNEAESLVLTAICALHPVVIGYSGSVMTEIPFAAVALAAIILAERAMTPDSRPALAAACGILSALSMLLRILGVPIAAGIFIAGVTRRAWKQTTVWSAAVAPFFCGLAWHALTAARILPPVSGAAAGPGYIQTWTYYTSYIGFRKLCMTSGHVVWEMFVSQFIFLLAHVPGLFIGSMFGEHIAPWFVATLAVLFVIIFGLVRQAKQFGWRPVHYSFAFYLAAVLTWQYPEIKRFLIPFLPLIAASLWYGSRVVARQLASSILAPKPPIERAFAGVAAVLAVALVVGMTWSFVFTGRTDLLKTSEDSARLLAQKREAYQWLRANSPPDARAVATEDAALYLYTGRQAMADIALIPAGLYDPLQMRQDLDHLTDVARAIEASYWVASPDDSGKESKAAKPRLAGRFAEIESVLPELFRSSDGEVKIYGTGCILHPEQPACANADRVLFPANSTSNR